ncbi:DUF192 domain-containing protein [Candidatus Parvarchaeota archaeon]|nr:DUF192 domain-containing protein [Candidatus Parvarchaeota archaeon]
MKNQKTKTKGETAAVEGRRIVNLDNGKVVCAGFEIADNPALRMRGLMFREKVVPILFKFGASGIWPIHSFFVGFEFDAIYLDEKMRVTEIFEKVLPFTALVSPTKPAVFLLELSAGAARKQGVKKGTRLAEKY